MLADSPDPVVRLLPAGHLLQWDPDRGSAILEAIADAPDSDGGLHRVTAEYTLRAFRAGMLDLDW